MKLTPMQKMNSLVSAGIWSAAVLALLGVGLLTFFSAASEKTVPSPSGKQENQTQEEQTENGEKDADAGLFDRFLSSREGETEEETTPPPIEKTDKPADPASPVVPSDISDGDDEPLPAVDDAPAAYYPGKATFSCVMPVNGTVSKEHTEDVAVYSLTMNDYRVHNGIDIDAPIGTNVAACAAGTVERVWEDPFLGTCISVEHGGGMKSLYANLSPDLPRGIEAGATVNAGDVIGGVGETMILEMADSSHLHFAMEADGVPVDPLDYISNYQGGSGVVYDE